MPKIPEFNNHDASLDLFFVKEFGDDSMWSLNPDVTSAVTGTGKYTILASNFSQVEGEMVEYRSLSTDVPIGYSIDSESFRFRYFAIKYTAGTATGVLNIYFEQTKDQ